MTMQYEESRKNRIICSDLYERASKFIPHFGWSLFAFANGYSSVEHLEADLILASLINNEPRIIRRKENFQKRIIAGKGIHIELSKLNDIGLDWSDTVIVGEIGNSFLICSRDAHEALKNNNNKQTRTVSTEYEQEE